MKKNIIILTAMLAIASLLLSCAPASPAGEETPKEAAKAKEITVIQVSSEYQAKQDPTNWYNQGCFDHGQMIFDGLVNWGIDGKTIPGLATSWKVSADKVELTLREGVKFHNGDPFTAEDVKFTYESILGPTSTAGYKANFKLIDSMEVVDKYHLIIHTKGPWLNFLNSNRTGCTPIAPKNYYQRLGPDEFSKKPVGTGPYKWDSHKFGEYTRFVVNEGYWGPAPEVKAITLKYVSEDLTRYAMLVRGEADAIIGIGETLEDEIRKTPGLSPVVSSYTGFIGLIFNRKSNPIFNDKRVREAIAIAIDRDAILKGVMLGLGEVATQCLVPPSVGYNPTIKPIPYDPARARQLIKEAGVEGKELEFMYQNSYYRGIGPVPKIDEAVASYLEAVGFKIKRILVDAGAATAKRRAGETQFGNSTNTGYTDAGDFIDMWIHTKGTYGKIYILDPRHDEYGDRASAAKTVEERDKILQDWAQFNRDDYAIVPLFYGVGSYAHGPRIKEWNPSAAAASFFNIHMIKLAD